MSSALAPLNLPPGSEDSLDVSGIGRQFDSKKDTMPAYSFGTCGREQASKKVYFGEKHEKAKAGLTSPGPIYSLPSSLSEGPVSTFGTGAARTTWKQKYPDSSIDLTGAVVDSQGVKYASPRGVCFGSESRTHSKNAEVLRGNPENAMGSCSPGHHCLPFQVKDDAIVQSPPKYSFGPRRPRIGEKPPARAALAPMSTPKFTGPASHQLPGAMGSQPTSARRTQPGYTFAGGKRDSSTPRGPSTQLDHSPELSSLGRQVVSKQKTSPDFGFGTSTRDHAAKTYLVQLGADKGPAANMPSPRLFHPELRLERSPDRRPIPKAGL